MKPKRRLLLIAAVVALVLAGLVLLFSLRPVQLYKVTVLPTSTWIMAINDRGQVVGVAGTMSKPRLFLWDRDNGVKDVGPIYLDNLDINNAGQIAGTMTDPNDNKQAFFWDPRDGRHLLGTFGGTETVAMALNNRGEVVGCSRRVDGRPAAFIWDKANGMRSLTPNEQQYGLARAINDSGQVIGKMGPRLATAAYPSWSPYYWDSTEPVTASVAPGLSSEDYPGGFAINNKGYVLLTKHRPVKHGTWLCLWRKDGKLEWLVPGDLAELKAFNEVNQVLYTAEDISLSERLRRKYRKTYSQSNTEHYLWDPKRGRIQLDNQVPSDIGKLCGIVDINNYGCIVGVIRTANQNQELVVLLEPIPERWGK